MINFILLNIYFIFAYSFFAATLMETGSVSTFSMFNSLKSTQSTASLSFWLLTLKQALTADSSDISCECDRA